MDKARARSLVRETFEHGFNRGRYESFLRDLLNRFEEKPLKYQGAYIPDAFKEQVASLERIGTYQAPGGERIDLLIVHLTKHSTLARARTALRNYVAHHLKTRDAKEAALVAFVSPSEPSWRFSYVRMEYATVTDERGRVGTKTELTPARRLSYLVGEGESCHTAQSRFLDILQQTSHDPTIEELEAAFSVEAVTKEFFEQYKALFLNLKDQLDALAAADKLVGREFAARRIDTVDFAKKLMGQIVFLYFLQKKGWLGVAKGRAWGTGPRDFIRRLTRGEFGVQGNIFNDILEPLFYDTLATDRGPDAWCSRFRCRIPFLNGGLFEPLGGYDWITTDIVIPDALFTNEEKTSAGDLGTGILDFFDRYNFTVNEAEPLEIEVAIDPEMLGKVFENLLEVRERKSKGSFYTPREIVHYMCEESLINYLDGRLNRKGKAVDRSEVEALIRAGEQAAHYEAARKDGTVSYARRLPAAVENHAQAIDEALSAITVCDPAIGSGAFPVGMMTEIVRARTTLTPYFEDTSVRTPYHFKRHAIQTCLYGVDIDPGAVEIAKLRLWLSLVVAEEDVRTINPLPNLDFKIVVGNSLLGVEKNLFNNRLFEQLEELKPKFFDESNRRKKAEIKDRIEALIQELTNGKEAFDFEIYFSEVMDPNRRGGFDVVIGNPPYVRQEAIKELKPALKAGGYECFTGTADLLVYFYERGVKLLHEGGTIALITSNKFYRAGYGEKLRRFLVRELTLHRLIDFGDAPVFEAVAYASILTGVRVKPARDASALAYTWEKELTFERIAQLVPERGQQIQQSELRSDGWQLESPAVFRLLEKLRQAGRPLGEYVNGRWYWGIKTGLNEAFVVDRETRDRLIREHKTSAELLTPILRGRDVKRWRANFSEQYLIKIESSENKDHPWSGKSEREAEKIFAATFPAIHAWFEDFRAALLKRADQGKYFWELRSCAYWNEFDQTKLVVPAISGAVNVSLDREGFLSNNKTSIFVCDDASFVSALLNSRVAFWFTRQVFATKQGGFYDFEPRYSSQWPIPAVQVERKQPVERLVQRILLAKERDAGADVSALERQLDELVYLLYGLTPEEITIVEDDATA
jgi:type I restriction-modification system DNA methylase subunit